MHTTQHAQDKCTRHTHRTHYTGCTTQDARQTHNIGHTTRIHNTHDTQHTHTTHTQMEIHFFQAMKEAEKHLEIVKSERSLYKSLCKMSTNTLKNHFGEDLQMEIHFFQAIKEAEKHLEIVKLEHSLYKSLCKTSTITLKSHFGEDLQQLPPPGAMLPVNTHNITVYYSFDMAQQVKIYTTY